MLWHIYYAYSYAGIISACLLLPTSEIKLFTLLDCRYLVNNPGTYIAVELFNPLLAVALYTRILFLRVCCTAVCSVPWALLLHVLHVMC